MSSFSTGHWIIIGLIVWGLYKIFNKGNEPVRYCKNCGHTGACESHTPGNVFIELILWLCIIVPGLIYSIWRVSSRKAKCTQCGSFDVVPSTSPVAVAARQKMGLAAEPAPRNDLN